MIRTFPASWDGFTEVVDDLVVARDLAVATGTYRGAWRATGRELAAEFCHLWRVRDGRLREFRQYTDTAAFAAVQRPR